MKYLFPIALIIAVTIFSCSGGKNVSLDKDPLLRIENPYWQKIIPGQEDAPQSMILILPYSVELMNYYVDSVFFKGYHGELVQSVINGQAVYRIHIMIEENQTIIAPPFPIEENEALVSYIDLDKIRHYFKVGNIIMKEPLIMP